VIIIKTLKLCLDLGQVYVINLFLSLKKVGRGGAGSSK
jgi:hypothetical protein